MSGNSKDAKKPKKEKKPKLTPQEKAIKQKEKVQKAASAMVARADAKIRKAEQAVKNKEKKEENKVKKQAQKEANAVKKLEKKQQDAEAKAEKKALAKIRKQEIREEKRAQKMQKRAELAARTPLQKKADRQQKLRRAGIVLAVIVLLSAVSYAGVKSAPLIAKQLNIPKFNIAEKLPIFKAKKTNEDKKDKEEEKDKDEKADKEEKDTTPNPEDPKEQDDKTLIVAGSKVLHPYYTEALGKFLKLDKKALKEQSVVLTTEEAFTNLINGDCQVVFSHLPTAKETRMATMAGKTLNPVPVLNGGFVFFVNKDNPVKNLTQTQLYNIYTGTVTNWEELGGEDAAIVAMQRTGKSAAQAEMYQEVVSEAEIQKAPDNLKFDSTSDIIAAVSADRNAIGFGHFYYFDSSKNKSDVALLKINGVEPTVNNIEKAKYPLTIYSYAIVAMDENTMDLENVLEQVDERIQKKRAAQQAENADAEAGDAADTADTAKDDEDTMPLKLKFIKWLLSDEGQKLAEKHGVIRHGNP